MTPEQFAMILGAIAESNSILSSNKTELMMLMVDVFRNKSVPGVPPVAPNIIPPVISTTPLPAGNVMIPEGFICECDQCKLSVYEIVTNVHENMNKKDFVACFKPLGEASALKMPLDTFADEGGNLAIDCPLCKGTKSLWIKGRGEPYNDIPENMK